MKILVIEDDALLLQGLILAMQSEGYVCDGVSTAHEAALSGQQPLQPGGSRPRPAG
jgi:two-component system response regulator BasR